MTTPSTPPKPDVGPLHLDDVQIWTTDLSEARREQEPETLRKALVDRFKETAGRIPCIKKDQGLWHAWYHSDRYKQPVFWTGS